MTDRQCSVCKETKPSTECATRSAKCRVCRNAAQYEWKRTNKELQAIIQRRVALKRNYGITMEQYDELLQSQSGCCAICNRHESEFSKRLAVDHSHKTGRIRGLLCTNCNHRLIGRHTDGELLRKMANYVEQGTDWFVPPKPKRSRATRSRVTRQTRRKNNV